MLRSQIKSSIIAISTELIRSKTKLVHNVHIYQFVLGDVLTKELRMSSNMNIMIHVHTLKVLSRNL